MATQLSVRYLPDGNVKVNVFGEIWHGTLRAWLNATDMALAVRNAAVQAGRKPESPKEKAAALWLHACGLNKQDKIDLYVQRRALFDSPEDAPRLVHCCRCGRVLSDPLSKALGIGPECRKK